MLHDEGISAPAAIVLLVLDAIREAVKHEAHHRREHHLASLILQKPLEIAVAEPGVLHVDLSDHSYLDAWYALDGNGGEVIGDLVELPLHVAPEVASVPLVAVSEYLRPFLYDALGIALVDLIRPCLV